MGTSSNSNMDEKVGNEINQLTVSIISKLPFFKYHSPKHERNYFSITNAAGNIEHKIHYVSDFYNVLGYVKQNSDLLFDEFIWDYYTRDGAKKTTHCLQLQLFIFLYNYSLTFLRQYSDVYNSMIGNCDLICRDEDDAHCKQCVFFKNSFK